MSKSKAIGLKITFMALGVAMIVTLIYTIAVDGLPFRRQLLTPWMIATLIDFYINVAVLVAWVLFKESNWISSIIWIILFVCLGSVTTCVYIIIQLFKLSPRESENDTIYHVLSRHSNNVNSVEQKSNLCSVTIGRVIFSTLGCLMLATLLYTLFTDGSPFRKELLTPWMIALLIDFYINVFVLSVWVAYKESSLISAVIWIIFFISLGSFATCVYVVTRLFQLTCQDPIYAVLFRISDRSERMYERTTS